MLKSIATVCVSGTLDKKLAAIAEAGFKAVEIFEPDLIAYPGSPRDIARMMEDLGLACVLYQPFRDFEGMPEPLRSRAFDRAERKFDLMGELGTDRILICSNCSPHSLPDRDRIIADFAELGERAARRGIIVGYEALAWGRHIHDHRQVWDIVKAVDHPAIGILLDSFHSLSRDIPIDSLAEIDGDKIAFVQLADAPRLDMNLLYWSRHFRSLPGQGDLPIAAYTAALLKTGYKGPLSLEIFNDRFRASSTSLVAHDALRSLTATIEDARRINGEPPRLPERARINGTEFIEFALSDEESERLVPMLRALGFRHTGRHHNKAVDRWQQGDINLVLNREQHGFAHSYRLIHGASICALGLRVPDGAAVLDRAASLDIPRFEQDPGPGNLAIPALRGVGGSLLYLVEDGKSDAIWRQEFEPVETPGPALLHGIDHIAASVDVDEYLSWQLFWTSLFEVEKQEELDILDPGGVVQSRAITTADGAFRVTINASGGRDTLSSRFIHHGFGAGFQHIAFSAPDILKAAHELARADLPVMDVPANYHADIAARFGLDDADVAALASAGLLYDEDEAGHRYWQLYSRAFDKRFFFEIVQREDYRGFGAANAPVRLAAQSRYKDPVVD